MDASSVFPAALYDRIKRVGIIAVLVIEDVKHAVPAARALVSGGITAIELALRTPASLGALEMISKEVPEMLCGVGTVIRPEQVEESRAHGASFIVTPGTSAAVIKRAVDAGIPIAPGVSTPSDIETALAFGCRVLKFFPAENMGGLSYLRAVNAPYAHLGLRYIPLGGVNEKNCGEYAHDPLVLGVGGSWIAPRDIIQKEDWETVTQNAARAVSLCSCVPASSRA